MERWMVGAGAWACALGCGPVVADDSAMDDGATSAASDSDAGSGTAVTTAGSGIATEDGGDDDVIDCAPTGSCEACDAWTASYQGPAGTSDSFLALAVAPDGTIVVAGRRDWVQDAGTADSVLVGYNAAGEQLWESTPLGTDDGVEDHAQSVAFAADGRLAVIVGRRVDVGYESSVLVLDAQREVLWSRQLAHAGVVGSAGAARFTDEGALIVLGAVTDDADLAVGVVQSWGEDGEVEWDRTGDDFAIVPGYLGAVAQSGSSLLVAGGTYESTPSDVWLGRIGVAGDVEWVVRDDADSYHWASSLVVLPGGDLVVVGAQYDADSNALSWAGRYAADGTTIWSRTYPATGCCANGLDAVVVDDNQRVFALGARGSDDGGLVLKLQELDCAGEIAWEWNHESPGWNTSFSGGLGWSPVTGLVASGSDFLEMDDQRGLLVRLDP